MRKEIIKKIRNCVPYFKDECTPTKIADYFLILIEDEYLKNITKHDAY